MTLNPSREIHQYWATKDPMYGNLWIQNQMSCAKWQFINANFHFDLYWIIEHHEKLFKVLILFVCYVFVEVKSIY